MKDPFEFWKRDISMDSAYCFQNLNKKNAHLFFKS